MHLSRVSLALLCLSIFTACEDGVSRLEDSGFHFNRPFSGYQFDSEEGYSIQLFDRAKREPLSNLTVYLRVEGELIESKTDQNGMVIYEVPTHVDSIDIFTQNSIFKECWMNLPQGNYLLGLQAKPGASLGAPTQREPPKKEQLVLNLPEPTKKPKNFVLYIEGFPWAGGVVDAGRDSIRIDIPTYYIENEFPYFFVLGEGITGQRNLYANPGFEIKSTVWSQGTLKRGSNALDTHKIKTTTKTLIHPEENRWLSKRNNIDTSITYSFIRNNERHPLSINIAEDIMGLGDGRSIEVPELPGFQRRAAFLVSQSLNEIDSGQTIASTALSRASIKFEGEQAIARRMHPTRIKKIDYLPPKLILNSRPAGTNLTTLTISARQKGSYGLGSAIIFLRWVNIPEEYNLQPILELLVPGNGENVVFDYLDVKDYGIPRIDAAASDPHSMLFQQQ